MGKTFQLAFFALSLPITLGGCSSSDGPGASPALQGGGGKSGSGGKSGGGGSGKPGSSAAGSDSSAAGSDSSAAGSDGDGTTTGVPSKPNEVGGCNVFPAADAWNLDVSAVAVDTAWTKKVNDLVGAAKMHPDYGVDGQDLYGIPLNIVPESQPLVNVTFDDYPDESDPGPYPFPGPDDVSIEGNRPESCDGDCHLLVVQQGTCILYEGYACEHRKDGWHCANGAKWDLNEVGYGQRPDGWTSADAAGLPVAPGLLRYDEVRAGEVTHALRFTLDCTTNTYVPPATHQAGSSGCPGPPMGTRVRLKSDYDISKLSESAQVVLTGMKKYGMILADNGASFYFQGEANAGWTDDDIEPLKSVPASAFEVLAMPQLTP